VSHAHHAGGAFADGIYAKAATDATYGALLQRARAALEQGESVVLDATWARASYRDRATRVAEATASDLVELECRVAPDVAAARIGARLERADEVSDATPEIAAAIAAAFEPWPGAQAIATDRAPESVVARALDLVGVA
jgi:predicted kinase